MRKIRIGSWVTVLYILGAAMIPAPRIRAQEQPQSTAVAVQGERLSEFGRRMDLLERRLEAFDLDRRLTMLEMSAKESVEQGQQTQRMIRTLLGVVFLAAARELWAIIRRQPKPS